MRIHPVCEPGCSHASVPTFDLVTEPKEGGQYVGMLGDAEWQVATWRIGKPFAIKIREEERVQDPIIVRDVDLSDLPKPVPQPFVFPRREVEKEPEPFPTPIPTETPAVPGPVATLVKKMEAAGWTVGTTYSRGYVPHATHGRPGEKPVDSWAVRCSRGDRRAVAVRHDGSWDSLWVWSPTIFFTRCKTLDYFLDAVAFGPWLLPSVLGPARPPKSFFEQAREVVDLLEEINTQDCEAPCG